MGRNKPATKAAKGKCGGKKSPPVSKPKKRKPSASAKTAGKAKPANFSWIDAVRRIANDD